ncbi:hypothetical protein IMCC3317_11220 [Kordia antarctica]|uniref:Uncharacterized protein n=1 Tax=Kordia antarctica TaxID=1218801 RepID=A0A7L4ZIM7_9FLAO|nr:hypothetical protein [Kordia antarctica]QHI35774.1 hypothetical protein IMCC3317_11220 [Kordia antarctica]
MNKERFLDIVTAIYMYYQHQNILFIPSTLDLNEQIEANCWVICHSNYLLSKEDFAYSMYNISLCVNSHLSTFSRTSYALEKVGHNHDLGENISIFFLPKFSLNEKGVNISKANILSDVGCDKNQYNYYGIVAAPKTSVSDYLVRDFNSHGIELFPLSRIY